MMATYNEPRARGHVMQVSHADEETPRRIQVKERERERERDKKDKTDNQEKTRNGKRV